MPPLSSFKRVHCCWSESTWCAQIRTCVAQLSVFAGHVSCASLVGLQFDGRLSCAHGHDCNLTYIVSFLRKQTHVTSREAASRTCPVCESRGTCIPSPSAPYWRPWMAPAALPISSGAGSALENWKPVAHKPESCLINWAPPYTCLVTQGRLVGPSCRRACDAVPTQGCLQRCCTISRLHADGGPNLCSSECSPR